MLTSHTQPTTPTQPNQKSPHYCRVKSNLIRQGRNSMFKLGLKDGLQIQVCNVSNECLTHFSQCYFSKVKKYLRKSQAQFREKLRKLRLTQNYDFLIKRRVFSLCFRSLRKNLFMKWSMLISGNTFLGMHCVFVTPVLT